MENHREAFDLEEALRSSLTTGHQDGLKMTGTMDAVLIKPDGTVTTYTRKNIIVTVGFDFIADAIGKPSGRPSVMSHIAVGTSSVGAAAGDTALKSELARKAATYSHTVGTKSFQFETTFNPGEAIGAITEAGVVNASSGGILFDRVVFDVINKGNDDTLTQRFTFTMS